jgi:hypothetical protein
MSEDEDGDAEAVDADETEAVEDGGVDERTADTDHLDELQAGAGCTEIWEHLSEHRERAGSD